MRPKPSAQKSPDERVIEDIRRATRKHYSSENKIRIVPNIIVFMLNLLEGENPPKPIPVLRERKIILLWARHRAISAM